MQVRVDTEEIFAQEHATDLLVALNKDTILKHIDCLKPGSGIIYDGEKITLEQDDPGRKDVRLFSVPLSGIVQQLGGKPILRNVVAIGASIGLVDYDLSLLDDLLTTSFRKKSEAVVRQNIDAARQGCDYAKANYADQFPWKLRKQDTEPRMLISGDRAVCLGALRAGCKFVAGYPMTPSTPILEYLASKERDYSLVVKQAEDEIAAINMVIGASLAGVRAMTCTSGGGFSLMVEGLGLAAMTEVPIVIVEGQRPGPSTSMATRTEQSDLKFALSASHGEFPRIVVAPGDAEECFYLTMEAFNLADKFQIQVIVLVDKYVLTSARTVERFDPRRVKIERGEFLSEAQLAEIGTYIRYSDTPTGASPRTIPGQKGGIFTTTSDEHNEVGHIHEGRENRTWIVDRRFRKLQAAERVIPAPQLHGEPEADVTLVGWGSTKGPILEAMKMLAHEGIRTSFLQIVYLSPFPAKRVSEILSKARKLILVENSKTAQLGGMIREHTGILISDQVLKYDGRPFTPEEIRIKVKEIL
jgi:2-oxoglutarate ferredoxin oxidoreductase subunit alpha